MTAAELIEELRKLLPDAVVRAPNHGSRGWTPVRAVAGLGPLAYIYTEDIAAVEPG